MADRSGTLVNSLGIPRSYFINRLPVQSDSQTINKILDRRPTTAYLQLQCASQDEIVDNILDRDTRASDGKTRRAEAQQRNDDLLVAGNLQANLKRALLMRKWLDREARKRGRKVDWSHANRLAAYAATEMRNFHLLPSRWQELMDAIKPMGSRLSTDSDEDDTSEPSGSRRRSLRKRAATGTQAGIGSKEKTDGAMIARPQGRIRNYGASVAARNAAWRTTSVRNALPPSTSNNTRNASPAGQVTPALAQHPEQLLQQSGAAATEDVVEDAVRSASNLLARKSVHSAGQTVLVPLAVTLWTFHRAEGISFAAMEERFGSLDGTTQDPLGSEVGEAAEAKVFEVADAPTGAVIEPKKAPTQVNKQTVSGKTPTTAGARHSSSTPKVRITAKKRKRDENGGQEGSEPVMAKKLKLLAGSRPDEINAEMRVAKNETEKDSDGQTSSKQAEMELLADLVGEGYLDVQDLMVVFNDLNAKAGRAMKNLDGFHDMLKDLLAKRQA